MDKRGVIFLAVALASFVFLLGAASAATTQCNTLASCNSAIAAAGPGGVVQMNQSITDLNNGTAINLNVSNVTFDCNGFSLTGPNQSNSFDYGIYFNSTGGGSNYDTLENCTVSGFYWGFDSWSNSYSTLLNNNFSGNYDNFYLDGSSNSNFNNSIDSSNIVDYSYKIYYNYSVSNYVFNSTTSPDAGVVYCAKCDNITLSGLNLSHKNGNGVYLFNTSNSRVHDLISNDNYNGIYTYASSNNTFENLSLRGNIEGIFLDSNSDDNILNNITSLANLFDGLDIESNSNNTITNSIFSAGLNSTNGLVSTEGVYLYDTYNNTLANITANFDDPGIYLDSGSFNNTFTNITANSGFGIDVDSGSGNNFFQDITANYCNNGGIYVYQSSNNKFSGVTSSFGNGNNVAVDVESSSNNTFENMTLDSDLYGGIRLYQSSNNTFSDSRVINSSNNSIGAFGLEVLTGSVNNTFYNNLFNNTVNTNIDNNLLNYFNTTKTLGMNIMGGPYIGGNYWAYPNGTGFSDNCTDSNDDGICDASYNLSNSVSMDYLPLSSYADTTPPAVTITYPSNSGSYSTGSVTKLDYTATDNAAVASCWYSLNGGATNSTPDANCADITGLTASAGSNTWTVYANDTSGNVGSASVTFSVSSPVSSGGSWSTTTGTTTTVNGISTVAGKPYKIDFNNSLIDLTSLTVTTKQSFSYFSISATPVESVLPADLNVSGSGSTYQSFQIATAVNDSNIANVSIGFRVNKSWISNNSFNPSFVSLYRNSGNGWVKLDTSLLSSDSQYYYFSAISPGFSNYTIFAKASVCNPGSLTCNGNNLELCSSAGEWTVKQNCQFGCSNSECLAKTASSNPWRYIIAAAILAVILFGVYFLLRRYVFLKRRLSWINLFRR